MSGIPGTYRNPHCEVRPSRVHGRGLFAARDLPAGDVIAIRGGHIVPKAVALQVDATLGGYSHPITDDFFLTPLDASEVADTVAFFNHGCSPNIEPVGQIVFAASRRIAAGEEILCDYATIVAYPEYRLRCRCGSPDCRGLVTGEDWRSPAIRARYRGRFSTQIERKIATEGRA